MKIYLCVEANTYAGMVKGVRDMLSDLTDKDRVLNNNATVIAGNTYALDYDITKEGDKIYPWDELRKEKAKAAKKGRKR